MSTRGRESSRRWRGRAASTAGSRRARTPLWKLALAAPAAWPWTARHRPVRRRLWHGLAVQKLVPRHRARCRSSPAAAAEDIEPTDGTSSAAFLGLPWSLAFDRHGKRRSPPTSRTGASARSTRPPGRSRRSSDRRRRERRARRVPPPSRALSHPDARWRRTRTGDTLCRAEPRYVFRISSTTRPRGSPLASGACSARATAGPPTSARFYASPGLGFDERGNLLIGDDGVESEGRRADADRHDVRRRRGRLAGRRRAGDERDAQRDPSDLADPAGNVYVCRQLVADPQGLDDVDPEHLRAARSTARASRATAGRPRRRPALPSDQRLSPTPPANLFIPDASNCRVRQIDLPRTSSTRSPSTARAAGRSTCARDLFEPRASRRHGRRRRTGRSSSPSRTSAASAPSFPARRRRGRSSPRRRTARRRPSRRPTLSFTRRREPSRTTSTSTRRSRRKRLVAANLPSRHRLALLDSAEKHVVTTFAASSLLPGRTYYWQVVARGGPELHRAPARTLLRSPRSRRRSPASQPGAVRPARRRLPARRSRGESRPTLSWTPADGRGLLRPLPRRPRSPPRLFKTGLTQTSLVGHGSPPRVASTPGSSSPTRPATPTKATGSPLATFLTSGPCNPIGPFNLASPPAGAVRRFGQPHPHLVRLRAGPRPTTSTWGRRPILRSTSRPWRATSFDRRRPLARGHVLLEGRRRARRATRRRTSSTPVASFTVSGTCNAPPRPSFTFVPPGAVVLGQSYVVAWSAVGLDPGGGYLVERSQRGLASRRSSTAS